MFERYTESARRALFFSRFEASQLGERTITAEVLLLGVLRDGKGVAGQILREADLSFDGLARELGAGKSDHEKFPTSVEIPFDPATHEILHLAMAEADELGHGYIGPEHLVLASLRHGQTTAAAILARHGLKYESTRAEVIRLSPTFPESVRSRTGPAFRVRDALGRLDTMASMVNQLKRMPTDPSLVQRLHTAIEHNIDALRRMFQGLS
jgi:ATP-dependent Clp protease ATP-binding subunit ClpC